MSGKLLLSRTDVRHVWENAEEYITERINDESCCTPLDQGIMPAVTSFQLLNLRTCMSCEGHMEDVYGLPNPWVDIHTKSQTRVLNLLSLFYSRRRVDYDCMLYMDHWAKNVARLQSHGAEVLAKRKKALPRSHRPWERVDIERCRRRYLAEMNAFSDFLRASV